MPLVTIIDGDSARIISALRNTSIGYKSKLYQSYLKTEYWQKVKRIMYHLAGKSCEVCGDNDCKLAVHHRSYARIGMEEEIDLQLLCDTCHEAKHNRNGSQILNQLGWKP